MKNAAQEVIAEFNANREMNMKIIQAMNESGKSAHEFAKAVMEFLVSDKGLAVFEKEGSVKASLYVIAGDLSSEMAPLTHAMSLAATIREEDARYKGKMGASIKSYSNY